MKHYRFLGAITVLYVAFQLISDITAGKIVELGIFTVSATVLYFPFTYIFSDVLTEVYGYARARAVVWQVLLVSVLAGVLYQIVVFLPPAAGFGANDAYAQVLGSVPRILIGGWIAVWTGALLNDYVMAKMKIWNNGQHFWMRAIASTVVGEGANTALFYVIALYGIIPNGLLLASILSGWFLKVAIETALTPVTAFVVGKIKVAEGEDHFDRETDFNPFAFWKFNKTATAPTR